MAEHTPGTWSVPHFARDDHPCKCAYVLSDSQWGPGAIATVHRQSEKNGEHNEPDDIAAANAHLISASPDLLDACLAYAKAYDETTGTIHVNDQMRAAIAKALGEAV